MGCLQGVLCLSSAFSPGGKKPRPCSAADAIHLASWAQVCWLPGDTEAVSREDKVTLSSGRVQGVSLQGGWAVDELFLEGPGQNTNEHPPQVLPHPSTWHPRGLWAVAPSSPCLGTLVSVAFVLGDVLIVHTCPCCCALHIQPPSRSHLNVHLSSFTAISADLHQKIKAEPWGMSTPPLHQVSHTLLMPGTRNPEPTGSSRHGWPRPAHPQKAADSEKGRGAGERQFPQGLCSSVLNTTCDNCLKRPGLRPHRQ